LQFVCSCLPPYPNRVATAVPARMALERALLINALQKTRVMNLGFNCVTQHDRRNADGATHSENHGHRRMNGATQKMK
jgi:hypothetical protein